MVCVVGPYHRTLSHDLHRDMDHHKGVERMNPQFLAVPKATATTAIYGAVGVGILLVISILLGLLSRKSWKTTDG